MNQRWSFAAFSIPFVVSSIAFAGSPEQEKALARQLYEQAAADMAAEAYDRACPRFEEASKHDPRHVRTLISLATCENRWGKLVSAQQRLEVARALAVDQGATDKITEIDDLSAEVKKRIPRLKILLAERFANACELAVFRSGVVVSKADFGKAVPLNIDTYELTASSPDKGVWNTKVQMKAGHTAEITIGGAKEATYMTNEDADEMTTSKRTAGPGRVLGFTGLGLGAAGIVAGSILGGFAISKNNASDDGHCDAANRCDPIGTRLRLDAQGYATASTALFAVGGVLLVGGIVLVATSPSKTNESAQVSLSVGPGGVRIQGRW